MCFVKPLDLPPPPLGVFSPTPPSTPGNPGITPVVSNPPTSNSFTPPHTAVPVGKKRSAEDTLDIKVHQTGGDHCWAPSCTPLSCPTPASQTHRPMDTSPARSHDTSKANLNGINNNNNTKSATNNNINNSSSISNNNTGSQQAPRTPLQGLPVSAASPIINGNLHTTNINNNSFTAPQPPPPQQSLSNSNTKTINTPTSISHIPTNNNNNNNTTANNNNKGLSAFTGVNIKSESSGGLQCFNYKSEDDQSGIIRPTGITEVRDTTPRYLINWNFL